ncbi:hypothetical protein TNIN_185511 [Trichonephila inaurata madagascariensis]|uniref:Uncharacterized protein n=1 Tax=Trichonephila inaurata madagascariensis TaxID=2747483 RepID=A0A8X6MIV5_9ARAC|nr:hypothetical protein TNIN_185511 [Trichonephila inaurata madagascariensis]
MREFEENEKKYDDEMYDALLDFDVLSLSREELERFLRDFFTEDYRKTVGMSNEEVDKVIEEFIESCNDPDFSPALFFKERMKELQQLLEETERKLRNLRMAFKNLVKNEMILRAAGIMPVKKHDVGVSTNFFE